MEWAIWGLDYLAQARKATHDDFNLAMEELKNYTYPVRNEDWFTSCQGIIQHLYHHSMEFYGDAKIPGSRFVSPDVFEAELDDYRAFVQEMVDELNGAEKNYRAKYKVDEPPVLIIVARRQVHTVLATIDYVHSKKLQPFSAPAGDPLEADVDLIVGLARRFHESILSLKDHPYGGKGINVENEWDCQFVFRAILAAYFTDIRDEEWNPSVAGTSARCEFFLKSLRTMIELKFVRKATDNKKIKLELASDFLDYGANLQVDHIVCLIYDPTCALKNPAAIEADLSGKKDGLTRVEVVISPRR